MSETKERSIRKTDGWIKFLNYALLVKITAINSKSVEIEFLRGSMDFRKSIPISIKYESLKLKSKFLDDIEQVYADIKKILFIHSLDIDNKEVSYYYHIESKQTKEYNFPNSDSAAESLNYFLDVDKALLKRIII